MNIFKNFFKSANTSGSTTRKLSYIEEHCDLPKVPEGYYWELASSKSLIPECETYKIRLKDKFSSRIYVEQWSVYETNEDGSLALILTPEKIERSARIVMNSDKVKAELAERSREIPDQSVNRKYLAR